MKYKFHHISRPIILLLLVFLSTACDSDSDFDGFTEVITPLRCTIPGKLQLDDDTQSLLSGYKN